MAKRASKRVSDPRMPSSNSKSSLIVRAQMAPAPGAAPAPAADGEEEGEELEVRDARTDWTRRDTVVYIAAFILATWVFAYIASSVMVQTLLRITY
jgi:hypothetical protein